MAFTIGKYGLDTLWSLGHLLVALYVTTFCFIVFVLGTVMRIVGLSFLAFLRYIRDEILIVLGTCSTEAVLPQMMRKLEHLGCARPVVGMVLPAGYTFNTDGTCIYLTMATIFIAQATNTPLGLMDQIVILAVLMLTSKDQDVDRLWAGEAGASAFLTKPVDVARLLATAGALLGGS